MLILQAHVMRKTSSHHISQPMFIVYVSSSCAGQNRSKALISMKPLKPLEMLVFLICTDSCAGPYHDEGCSGGDFDGGMQVSGACLDVYACSCTFDVSISCACASQLLVSCCYQAPPVQSMCCSMNVCPNCQRAHCVGCCWPVQAFA